MDRKSKFEAHLAAVTTGAQVNWVYRTLLQDKRIARASHNVVSWRYFDAEKQVHCSDNDDDGEAGAGNRLAEMMHLMGANGVFVMVSRYESYESYESYELTRTVHPGQQQFLCFTFLFAFFFGATSASAHALTAPAPSVCRCLRASAQGTTAGCTWVPTGSSTLTTARENCWMQEGSGRKSKAKRKRSRHTS